jgi:hypothetical protein
MLFHLLIAVVGVIGLAWFWIAVQAIARRQSPGMARDCDVLECRMCSKGSCLCGIDEYESCATRGLDAAK